MGTWADVAQAAGELPGVTAESIYDGWRAWKLRGRSIAWERPLGVKDRVALGENAWAGDILAVRVADQDSKQALIADDPEIYFTIPHFDGFPAVLVRLERLPASELAGLLADAWRLRATKTMVKQHPEI